jgi:hypothetical protein
LNRIGSFAMPDQRQVWASTQTSGNPRSQVKPAPWPLRKTALPKPTSRLTSMVVNAALAAGAVAPEALALGAVAAGALALGEIAAGAIAAGALALGAIAPGALAPGAIVKVDFAIGFSFGFRAAFAALLVIFIFSVHSFNGRRMRPPPRLPASSLHSTLPPP